MKFTTATLMALGLVSSVCAGPIIAEPRAANISIVYEEKVENGLFQIFLDESLPAADAVTDNTLNKRCGSNQVNCDYNNNRAVTGICGLLMDNLGADRALSASQMTSICFTASNISGNNKCCVSWATKVSGLVRAHLLPAATDAFRCDRDGLVSASVGDVDLNGYCGPQCLSNRETGC